MSYSIITDSSCDLSLQQAKELGISMVQLSVEVNEQLMPTTSWITPPFISGCVMVLPQKLLQPTLSSGRAQ